MITARIGSKLYHLPENLEDYFHKFRSGIIGIDQQFDSPYGKKPIIYADWTASGRLFRPIEQKITDVFGPFMANTHTESNITSLMMTGIYNQSRRIIKEHVNADENDALILDGFGMTSVMNKLQRFLGIRVPEQWTDRIKLSKRETPVVFLTHMEHHSNQTSWLETIADVEIIRPDSKGAVDINHLEQLLSQYRDRAIKIGSFTACSNVTGIQTPYHQLAKIMHKHGGLCFVDFAASAPYVKIDMHPKDPREKLDAILFSPHKFLGGPGTSGVLLFDKRIYSSKVPDHPGGGTVTWTNPWGEHHYIEDIELREDGGTPGILQAIRTALCIKLKEQMGVEKILAREKEQLELLLTGLENVPNLHVLESHHQNRIGIVSFTITNIHYNLIVKLLNDRFGFQVRGGCSCAGTYGHYLLKIDKNESKQIANKIDTGDLSTKPGWVRFSLHPIMTNEEILLFVDAIKEISKNIEEWKKDYVYDPAGNDYFYNQHIRKDMSPLFSLEDE
ncbi:aminotransferase class V-fold PLP-dependent enzyme [Neobacillus sp. 179-C4.2 HS]|uniref:Aminotransferase class V-fold PLP-dependent enzyme n=1 Tax=Neobacillus driksii TaxID=3035913 RepID=A0ABV4YRD2_9BACI|nr:aminotransferase class V-fold PLP-dependent enzyme [Neobacillus sp. 179.-C4.2 HS]MDP5193722.1 aminotransferase class V-fold PLP-dependent enzyme [Neobacillus sp. 179.-C4.2 HS]